MYKRSTKIADLNLLLTVFIVLLHSLYNPLRLSSESGMYTWIYVFLKTLFDVAVPTFFFIYYVVIRIVSYIFPHEITIFLAFLRPCIILFICFIIAWCLKFVLNNKLWKLLNGSR